MTDTAEIRSALEGIEPDYSVPARAGIGALASLQELTRDAHPTGPRAVYAVGAVMEKAESDDTHAQRVAFQILDEAAGSDDDLMRGAAAHAAHALEPTIAAPIVQRLLDDPDPGVRVICMEMLPAALTPELAQRFEEIRDGKTDEPQLREMAATILEQHPRV